MPPNFDDLDDILDPARLAALWSKPVARRTEITPAAASPAPALPVTASPAPATPAALPKLQLVPAESDRAAAPEHVQPAPIDVHAHLRELLRAIDDELGAHFDAASPQRRALDAHIELLRARLAAAWPAGTTPAPGGAAGHGVSAPAAAAEALPLLDQIEDLLEALLRAGPWNA